MHIVENIEMNVPVARMNSFVPPDVLGRLVIKGKHIIDTHVPTIIAVK